MNRIRILFLAAATCLLTGCQGTKTESVSDSDIESAAESPAVSAAPTDTSTAKRYQGGEGDEAHANDPLPEYFTYRFTPDGISVRLAGGTYQAIRFDLTDALQHHADEMFELTDADDDGDYDLSVPVQFDGETAAAYAVFLWDSDAKQFTETPILRQSGAEIQTPS